VKEMRLRELAERDDGTFHVRMLIDADTKIDGNPIVIAIRNRHTLQRVVFRVPGEGALEAFYHALAICPKDLLSEVFDETTAAMVA
jgi:hypothetical protein